MVAAARLSELRGLCAPGVADRLRELLKSLQLPTVIPRNIAAGDMLDCMQIDKKNRAGKRRLILLEALGHAIIDDASPDESVLEAIEACR